MITVKKLLLGSGLTIGIGLLALSYKWDMVFPPTTQWTDQDQAKLGQAQTNYHELHYKAGIARDKGQPDASRLENDLRHWKMEWETQNSRLQDVQNGNKLTKQILYWVGIALIACSTAGALYFREPAEVKA
jgi:hypothetical protein